jgi:predicted DNA-binding transcriptional regulator AlpA
MWSAKMPKAKAKKKPAATPHLDGPLSPDLFYRITDARKYFGLKPTQLSERIKSRDIPPPVKLSASGRAAGWFGRTILAWQAERIAASKMEVV